MGTKRPSSEEEVHVVMKQHRIGSRPHHTNIIHPTSETTNNDIVHVNEKRDGSPSQPFRFLDLPTELRLAVYHYVIPHQMTILLRGLEDKAVMYNGKEQHPQQLKSGHVKRSQFGAMRKIFQVNKVMCNEARSVLYGENKFEFTIDANSHRPISLRSPQIFGPFGTPSRLQMLRDLRIVQFNVALTEWDHWAVKRHRARLEYFIAVLKEHSDDANQRSLLECMTISFSVRLRPRPVLLGTAPRPALEREKIFGLEPLASFRGVKHVDIVGEVPEWFVACLKLCIQGTGGEVRPIEYPKVEVRRHVRTEAWPRRYRIKKVMQSSKMWYEPTLDWSEFAARNGIEMPGEK